ncbi:phosphoglucomutase/phosphomannomutase [Legionella pneumophila]|nr:phosphoglucomutase/phosphomannomutase [Legionella pneumophila]
MSQRKYFGTDGIRGHVGLSNINPEFVLKTRLGSRLRSCERSEEKGSDW